MSHIRRLATLICLTLTVLLFSTTGGESADFWKGLRSYATGDYASALREWVPLAEQGNVEAQYQLGLMYDEGQGVLKDHKTAMKWYKLAADQGHEGARHTLTETCP